MSSTHPRSAPAARAPESRHAREEPADGYPENPVLTRIWRGSWIESQHRGSWVLVDGSGKVVDGAGHYNRSIFARSSVKSLQALPLLESGAAERFSYTDAELALALASHSAELQHTQTVAGVLARLGLSVSDLQCGPQPPLDPQARAELEQRGEAPSALHNNCSGKHAGFLALALHLGVPPQRYLDPESEVQRLVRAALEEMTLVDPQEVTVAVDGCSAPTFRLPLARLATGLARMANPQALPAVRRQACERMARAVERHPELIAGRHRRLCTDLVRASGGRLFPKIGGEAVYVIGVRGRDLGLAIKIDDGATRGFHALVLELLGRFDLLSARELAALGSWGERSLRNWAGLEVGRVEVTA